MTPAGSTGSPRQPAYVAVVGPGDEATAEDCAVAGRVGQLLAERGAILVCGGLGGVMQAAAEGTRARGGTAVGLLPGRDRAAGNPALSIALPTGLGELRNGLVVGVSNAVIAVGGSWGTQSEIALAMRSARPVAIINGWPVRIPDGSPASAPPSVASAEAAVSAIFTALGR